MPTIELTDEQAEELRSALQYECDNLDREAREAECIGGRDDATAIAYRHQKSVLSDILELLEIA
jgi:hypothetical protein